MPIDAPTEASEAPVGPARTTEAERAAEIQSLIRRGNLAGARDLFGEIVSRQQRRASRIAYHYLRDGADADEAVQDAFVKAFTHIDAFKPELSFEAWLTRILINGCLDRRKMRARRDRWLLPIRDLPTGASGPEARAVSSAATPEQAMYAFERRRQIARAIGRLPDRQRTVFLLSHVGDRSAREVAAATGLKESTVRVHLFRAVRKLRAALGKAS